VVERSSAKCKCKCECRCRFRELGCVAAVGRSPVLGRIGIGAGTGTLALWHSGGTTLHKYSKVAKG
jgi:hypothetical protein